MECRDSRALFVGKDGSMHHFERFKFRISSSTRFNDGAETTNSSQHLLENVEVKEEFIKIRIGDLLKTSKHNRHLSELFVEKYEHEKSLCVVQTIKNLPRMD